MRQQPNTRRFAHEMNPSQGHVRSRRVTGVTRPGQLAPSVLLDGPTKLRAADSVTVRGENWTIECNDTVSCSAGCSGDNCVGGESERPLRNITILLTPARGQEGAQVLLAEGVDAASDLTFDVDLSIPPQAPPGGYRLAAHSVGGSLVYGPRIRIVD